MKFSFLVFTLLFSYLSFASRPGSMTCSDAEFGAGHLKVVISDTSGFFYPQSMPRDQKPIVGGEFWIKGEMLTGVFELPVFMPDWGQNSGWYKSTPSPLEFSLCNWKKCPVRKIKLMVITKDQLKGEGTIKFLHHLASGERVNYDRKLNCEIK